MGRRIKPGEKGYRKEQVNPAAEANKRAWAKKKAASVSTDPGGRPVSVNPKPSGVTTKPSGVTNFGRDIKAAFQPKGAVDAGGRPISGTPNKEGLVNFPPSSVTPTGHGLTIQNLVETPYMRAAREAGIDVKSGAGGLEFIIGLGAAGKVSTLATKIGAKPGTSTIVGLTGQTVNAATKATLLGWSTKVANAFKSPKMAAGILATAGTASILASLSGKGLNSFLKEESHQMVSFVRSAAYRHAVDTGNWDIYDQAALLESDVLQDVFGWDEAKSWIPWKNAIDGVELYRQTAISVAKLWDQMAADKRLQQETGMTEADIWARNKQEEHEQELFVIDYYNEERKKMLQYEADLNRQIRAETDENNIKQMRIQAEFWAREREKQREKEAQDRIAIAEFWNDYRKLRQKNIEEARPSKLNFGIV